ncbi:peptidyl-prolyl cis-trans isomerase [Helicobacter sp. 11S02629-2]|uniref:peptidyl-prolyl cis-trans isomerase n=1 Tax=Helicobacter sp. 11S02629-2 TaxID=1476195 RepID=UPI000BA72C06|nr:peptidyl-prolyl cis-trans isomerase [Helicobacter sp. 11S02629-2]PAF45896.1 hypothetical protein BKH40_00340 [Helicobacter sp. 11S02629-2]
MHFMTRLLLCSTPLIFSIALAKDLALANTPASKLDNPQASKLDGTKGSTSKDSASKSDIDTASDVVGGIAILVNREPITLYQITSLEKSMKIDRKDAIKLLIDNKLKEEEVRRLKIVVSDDDVDSQINALAKQNHMSLDQFYTEVEKQGFTLSSYRKKLKEQMLDNSLFGKILYSSNNIGQDDELRDYYNKHQEEFNIPKALDVIKYVANNRATLEKFLKSKDTKTLPKGIAKDSEKIELKDLPPQVADILIATKEGEFSPVLESDTSTFVSFFITKKEDIEHIDFQKAKNYIVQKLIATKQDQILSEYFQKVKARSNIEILRN